MENQSLINLDSDGRKGNGGKRLGAGRKPMDMDARFLAARTNVTPVYATAVLSTLVNEREMWRKIFSCEDERVLLDAMKFLVSMRDGKPAQQINVTSLGVTITASEAQKAREIVRELMTPSTPIRHEETANDAVCSPRIESEGQPLMLGEGGGGK